MGNYRVCKLPPAKYWGDEIKDEMGGAFGTHGTEEICT
jgi:hypothetical protein